MGNKIGRKRRSHYYYKRNVCDMKRPNIKLTSQYASLHYGKNYGYTRQHSALYTEQIYRSRAHKVSSDYSCVECGGTSIDWRNDCPSCRPYANIGTGRLPESSPYYDYANDLDNMYSYADVGPRDILYEAYMFYDGKAFIQKYRSRDNDEQYPTTASVESSQDESVHYDEQNPYLWSNPVESEDDYISMISSMIVHKCKNCGMGTTVHTQTCPSCRPTTFESEHSEPSNNEDDVYETIPVDLTNWQLKPADAIACLVDIYRHIIESRVNVDEVIINISFIKDSNIFCKMNRANPKEAMQALFQRIQSATEPGKWKMFLDALQAAGYIHIVGLINGDIVDDNEKARAYLILQTDELAQKIDPKDMVDELLEKKLISQNEKQEITCAQTQRGAVQAALLLIQKVPNRLTNWFEIFNDILSKHGVDPLKYDLRDDND